MFDETGPLVAVWFNQPWLARQLGEGAMVLLHGKLRQRNQFWVTEHELIGNGEAPVHTRGPRAGAPRHAGRQPAAAAASSPGRRTRACSRRSSRCPRACASRRQLPERPAAIDAAHFPTARRTSATRAAGSPSRSCSCSSSPWRGAGAPGARDAARGRWRRAGWWWTAGAGRSRSSSPATSSGRSRRSTRTSAGERPMQRLLMGEVGSGKTVVALAAMLRAVENGAQAALMAPTETLAEQHHRTLDSLLGGPLPVELLTGSTSAARRRELLDRLASGQLQLVVGTHALIEDPVEFRDLAVVVVDEQHRFGVRQRAALDAKAPEDLVPHALHMTATPIPRTLSLTAYGDLDATVLRELPRGPPAGGDPRGRRRPRAGARVRAHPRGDRGGAAVLRGLPARRGVRGAPGEGGHRRVRAPAHDRVRGPPRGADPRPDAVEAEGGGDGDVRRAARPTCWWPPA